jgi:hypothetical protein
MIPYIYETFFEPMYLIVRRFFLFSCVKFCEMSIILICHDVVTHKTDIHEIT